MTIENTGTGAANNASVETQELTSEGVATVNAADLADPEEQARADRAASLREQAEALVTSRRARVERLTAQLEGEQAALDSAQADLDNLSTEA